MAKNHFSNTLNSPYFWIDENQEQCFCGKLSCRIENMFKKIFNKNGKNGKK